MVAPIEASIEIRATPEQVFDFVEDRARLAAEGNEAFARAAQGADRRLSTVSLVASLIETRST
jgi:hypothetical protein